MICRVLKWSIRAYQLLLSPSIGWHCRFEPSCSQFALQALDIHGPWHGCRLILGRLCRCRPGGHFGLDPVPHRQK